jgi:hypothetical protein
VGRTARIGCAIAAALLTAVLCGCGGDDRSGASPSQDPTALPSPASSSIESAQHFIRRWVAAEARMENTGRTAAFLALSRKCDECRALAHNIARRYAAGGYIRWDGLRIDSIKAPPSSQRVMLFTIHGHSAAMTYRDASSQPEHHLRGRRVTYLVGVMSEPGSPSVTSWTSY